MRYIFILAVLSAFAVDALAQSKTLRVCVDASGASTYTDQPCPVGSVEKSATPVDPAMSRAVESSSYAADSAPSPRMDSVFRVEPQESAAAKRKKLCNDARAYEASERKRLGNRITGQIARDLTDQTWKACHGR